MSSSAFPSAFEFYDLGVVMPFPAAGAAPEGGPALPEPGLKGYAFSLSGAVRGVVAVLMEAVDDEGMSAELANVIASRAADGLSRSEGGGLPTWISPPRAATSETVAAWARGGGAVSRQGYSHSLAGRSVAVDAWLIIDGRGEAAHA